MSRVLEKLNRHGWCPSLAMSSFPIEHCMRKLGHCGYDLEKSRLYTNTGCCIDSHYSFADGT